LRVICLEEFQDFFSEIDPERGMEMIVSENYCEEGDYDIELAFNP
jgi:hypothetical protein